MRLEEEVRKIDLEIERGYLDLVVNRYSPLFERVKEVAIKHMTSENITEIDLRISSGLFFRQDGKFYNKQGKLVELKELPKIYQDNCEGSRSIHSAMGIAFSCFRDVVKQSLVDII